MPNIPILPGDDFVSVGRKITVNWIKWLIAIATFAYNCPTEVGVYASDTPLTAALPVTPIPTALLVAGRYRITATARVVVPSGATSSIKVHVHATQGGASVQADGNAATGNTTSALSTGTGTFNVTANSALGVSCDYASTGAPDMAYEIFAVAEALP